MDNECQITPEHERRFGIWSNVAKEWAKDTTGRLISYMTLYEAKAHLVQGPRAHFDRAEWAAAEIGADGMPILRAEDVEQPQWTLKRSQEAQF